ncbi:MAG: TM2 domain-containing protein [Thalassovita sp.]|nr:TM2 domain-containing protein [Thalassovita sp.]
MSAEQRIRIEQQLTNERKSIGLAYMLLLLLGIFGGHRFYLGKIGSALIMLATSTLGWVTLALAGKAILLFPLGVWIILDVFKVPRMIRADTELRRNLLSCRIDRIG